MFDHMDEFLTSPMEASPFLDDDILNTPALGSDLTVSPDILTSPIFDFPASGVCSVVCQHYDRPYPRWVRKLVCRTERDADAGSVSHSTLAF